MSRTEKGSGERKHEASFHFLTPVVNCFSSQEGDWYLLSLYLALCFYKVITAPWGLFGIGPSPRTVPLREKGLRLEPFLPLRFQGFDFHPREGPTRLMSTEHLINNHH